MLGRVFETGLVLGLALGPTCALTCAPVLLGPLAGELGRGARAPGVLARFLVGRLVGYALFGAAAGGLLGRWFLGLPVETVRAASSAAFLALGLALLALGARYARGATVHALCPARGFARLGRRAARFAGAPVLLGLLTGLFPCLPFLIAAVVAVRAGSWLGGLVLFLGFFLGSNALLAPAALFSPRSDRARRLALRLGAVAAVLAGLFYALAGLRALSPAAAPAGRPVLTEKLAQRVFPGGVRFKRENDRVLRALLQPEPAAEEEIAGFAILGEAIGYAGPPFPVTVVVALSPEEKILRTEMLSGAEGPTYLARLERARFMERFKGRSREDPIELGEDIDAVSGATVTAEAVCAAVRSAVHSLEGAGAVAAPPAWAWPGWKALLSAAFVLLAAALAPSLRGTARRILLVVSVVVLGLWLQRFLSVADLARLATRPLAGWGEGAGLVLFLVVILAATLWRGRVWCTHLCPFGALSELAGRAARASARTPRPLARAGRVLPWLLLGAVSAAIAWTGRTEAAGAEPFGATFGVLSRPLSAAGAWRDAPAALLLAALVLAMSLVSRRFYCRHLCGAGAVVRLVARVRAGRGSAVPALEESEGG